MIWIDVRDMYESVKNTNIKLLSDFDSTFWNDYKEHHVYYDRLFKTMFGGFRYFDQIPMFRVEEKTNESISTLREEFTDSVFSYLLINKKRFDELYRVSQLTSEEYPILNNYDITETRQASNSKEVENSFGARTDNGTNNIGARADTDTMVQGSQTTEREFGIAGFNSSDYSDDRNENMNVGARTDTVNSSKGARADSSSFTKGAQTDNVSENGTDEYVLTRKGNIGVKTVSQMLQEHIDVWTPYQFYTMIFKEICANFLLI